MGSKKYKFSKTNNTTNKQPINAPLQEAQKIIVKQANFINLLKQELNARTYALECLSLISFKDIYKEKIIFPKNDNPLVSIIIPVYNQYRYTKACLYQILKSVKDISYEIIIADDNSTDETTNILNEVENITVSRNDTNLGFLLNVNKASKLAKGKYICLLNNDTLPKDDWLKHLVQTMDSNDDVGIVGAKFLLPNGLIQEAGSKISSTGQPYWYGHMQKADDPEFNQEKEVDYCSGCGLLIRKSAWDKAGGFDEQLAPAFYEDPDLSFTFKYKFGLKTMYQPKAEITHFHNISYQFSTHTSHENRVVFCKKWEKELQQDIYK